MNEEIKIARDRAHQGNALHDRATLRDQEFVDVTCELAASRQKAIDAKSDCLSQIAAMSEEIEETRQELRIQESFVYQSRARMPPKWPSRRMPKIVDELY